MKYLNFKKRFYTLLSFALFSIVAYGKPNTPSYAVISGKLTGFGNMPAIERIDAISALSIDGDNILIKGTTDGKFNLQLPVSAPGYYRLGRNILYLCPGDNLTIEVDYDYPERAIFKGKGSEANDYLKETPFPKAGSFLDGGQNVKKDIKSTFDYILERAKNREQDLLSRKNVSKGFIALEQARIKADVINSLGMNLAFYYGYTENRDITEADLTPLKKEVDEICGSVEKSYLTGFANADYLQLEVYQSIAPLIIKSNNSTDTEVKKISDWLHAYYIVNELIRTEDKKTIQEYGLAKLQEIKNIKFRDAAQKVYNELTRFGDGDEAINFTATDLKGAPQSIEQFKGKVIFIDMWATWCGPCMQEMPYFEKLKTHYKDNKDIVFISLSIDEKTDEWAKNVKARNAEGLQWNINRAKLKDYNIKGIPRVIVIGKDFKIFKMQGPMPSSENITEILDGIIKM